MVFRIEDVRRRHSLKQVDDFIMIVGCFEDQQPSIVDKIDGVTFNLKGMNIHKHEVWNVVGWDVDVIQDLAFTSVKFEMVKM